MENTIKKKYVTLNSKWKEIVFAASGFGPNLLMVLMGAMFTDAVNPSALNMGSLQAIGNVCYVICFFVQKTEMSCIRHFSVC